MADDKKVIVYELKTKGEKEVTKTFDGISGTVNKLPSGIAKVASGFIAMFAKIKAAMATNPLGLLAIALAAIIGAAGAFFASMEAGMDKIKMWIAPVLGAFEAMKGILQDIFMGNDVGDWTERVKDGADAMKEIERLAISIKNQEIELIKLRSEINLQLKEQELIAKDLNKTVEERTIASAKAKQLEQELYQAEKRTLDDRIAKMRLEQSMNETTRDEKEELVRLEARQNTLLSKGVDLRIKYQRIDRKIASDKKKALVDEYKKQKAIHDAQEIFEDRLDGYETRSLKRQLDKAKAADNFDEIRRVSLLLADKENTKSAKQVAKNYKDNLVFEGESLKAKFKNIEADREKGKAKAEEHEADRKLLNQEIVIFNAKTKASKEEESRMASRRAKFEEDEKNLIKMNKDGENQLAKYNKETREYNERFQNALENITKEVAAFNEEKKETHKELLRNLTKDEKAHYEKGLEELNKSIATELDAREKMVDTLADNFDEETEEQIQRELDRLVRINDAKREWEEETRELEATNIDERAELDRDRTMEQFATDRDMLIDAKAKDLLTETEYANAIESLEKNRTARLKAIDDAATEAKMQNAGRAFSAFGALATQASAFAEDGRALAYTGAVLDAASAVMGTWAGYAKFGFLGTAAAVAQTAGIGLTLGTQLSSINSAGKDKASKTSNNNPKFANGGIVGGNSYSGDRITANVNSREMILNDIQQAKLFAMANGESNSGLSREEVAEMIVTGLNSQKVYVTEGDITGKQIEVTEREREFND